MSSDGNFFYRGYDQSSHWDQQASAVFCFIPHKLKWNIVKWGAGSMCTADKLIQWLCATCFEKLSRVLPTPHVPFKMSHELFQQRRQFISAILRSSPAFRLIHCRKKKNSWRSKKQKFCFCQTSRCWTRTKPGVLGSCPVSSPVGRLVTVKTTTDDKLINNLTSHLYSEVKSQVAFGFIW